MMNRTVHIAFVVLLLGIISSCANQADSNGSNSENYDVRVAPLLAQMSLEEKVGQMTNISLMAIAEGEFWMRRDTVILDSEKMQELLAKHHIGSVQNLGTYPFSPEEWRAQIANVQSYVQENTRLQIPILYGIDAVHGANYTAGSTLLPQQLAMAATWNVDLSETSGQLTAYELRASGIPWNYAPVLDVCKQPLWGRIFETYGEDTYLTSEMGTAYLRGSQGDSLDDPYAAAVCLKHFLAYGAPNNGKDRSPTHLPERILRQTYLPPFEAAVKAGAKTVMLNSGAINGTPSHADYRLITEWLKGELQFNGFTISDWEDVTNLVKTHQVAANEKEAVKLAVNAGLDMCMEPYDASFAEYLVELVNEGEVKMSRIDDAVSRILNVKFELGLFDQIQTDASRYPNFGSERFAQISEEAALEAMTLLKNEDDILPLDKNAKVLVTGVASNSLNYLNGAWSRTWSGQETEFNDDKPTVLDAIRTQVGASKVKYAAGTDYLEDINTTEAVRLAKGVDYVIVCLGEKPATEKPSDIDDLAMPQAQLDMVHQLSETGKPIILVLVQSRPRLIEQIADKVDAIIMAYLPGNEGGIAIAKTIYGDSNPSGKLPITYPKYSGSIWSYDHTKSDERDAGFGYDAFHPQFKFGHGLSYTDFDYSRVQLSIDSIGMNDTLVVSVQVTNVGERAGKEVVQLYSRDLVASITPAVKQLRRFEKVSLKPNESKHVSFQLTAEDLAFVDKNNNWVAETGDFLLQVDTLTAQFHLKR